MLNLPPLPLVELYVELQSDEAEISQAYSYNNLISTLYHTIPTPPKWLTHFAAVTSADAPVNYGDFLLFTALELAISSFTAAVDESELPDGLGKWWNKMLKTKAVAALKGKGKKLMPGEHNKAW